MEERDLVDELGAIIRDAEERRFEPGFSDRVMQRIRAQGEVSVIAISSLAKGLERQFLRLAPIAAAILVALGAYSLLGLGASSGQSPIETALGLEPLTIETAYALDRGYYALDDESR